MDHLEPEQRSALMAKVRSRNTTPEIRVRRVAHALGLRFRLHQTNLAGSPDLVFPRHRVALFVHGCFWHRHQNCSRSTLPKTRRAFWQKKLADNVERDRLAVEALQRGGWRVDIIWECETRRAAQLNQHLQQLFELNPK